MQVLIFLKEELDYEEISNKVISSLNSFNSVLLVVNTKKSAFEMFNRVIKKGIKVFYLSTNLCAEHRSEVIEKIRISITNKDKFLCVSTQLIEAGVDLDFNCAFRFISGLDSIIQTAGRCNREGKLKNEKGEYIKGNVYIVNCREEKLGNICKYT